MNATLFLIAASLLPMPNGNAKDLFSKLDRNQDGKVTPDELSSSQQTFFKRALRVADRDEDGALTADELAVALADPKPVELPGTNLAGRAADFDFKSLDKNNDGELTLEEVPAPMRGRFEQLLDRIGKKSIPVDAVQAYLRGERLPETSKNPDEPGDQMNVESMKAEGESADRLMAIMKRLDANGNGKIEKDEQATFPQLAAMLDRNRDGRISDDELKPRASESEPKVKPAEPRPGKNAGRPGQEMPDNLFGQLDRNADGKLSGDEIPRRMQQNIRAADLNKDGTISQSEFEEAFKRRMQK